jgi:hypothetical protein
VPIIHIHPSVRRCISGAVDKVSLNKVRNKPIYTKIIFMQPHFMRLFFFRASQLPCKPRHTFINYTSDNLHLS